MNAFATWYAKSPLASTLRVFAAIIIAAAVADWSTKGSIDFTSWQTWLIAGAVSVLPAFTRALNPADDAFGKGSPNAGDIHDVFTED